MQISPLSNNFLPLLCTQRLHGKDVTCEQHIDEVAEKNTNEEEDLLRQLEEDITTAHDTLTSVTQELQGKRTELTSATASLESCLESLSTAEARQVTLNASILETETLLSSLQEKVQTAKNAVTTEPVNTPKEEAKVEEKKEENEDVKEEEEDEDHGKSVVTKPSKGVKTLVSMYDKK